MAIMMKGPALIILACCAVHFTLEAKAAPVTSDTGAVEYLSQFGYLPPMNPKVQTIMSADTLSNAISEFQSFVGINVTGNMDEETAHLMSMPRCGNKDKFGISVNRRSRRWAAFGSPWAEKSLTYKISKYPSTRLDQATVDNELAKALGVWSKYTDLTFTPTSGEVDIEISFVQGHHGDNNPFDGPASYGRSNVLAHAYSPGSGLGGDAHFDDDEEWTVDSYDGINLFQVAAHEFGHALGLDHSQVSSALMAPVYRSYEPNFQLHTDDIEGIQAIYGPKTNGGGYAPETEYGGHVSETGDEGYVPEKGNGGYVPESDNGEDVFGTEEEEHVPDIESGEDVSDTQEEEEYSPETDNGEDVFETEEEEYTPETESKEDEYQPTDESTDVCKDPQIDTIFSTAEGYTYIFKGNHYWWVTTNGMAPGYPKLIESGWKGLPGNIDAAFTYNGKTYFFKGSQYWSFVNGQMNDGYPKDIGTGFPGIPDNIDTATVGNRGRQIYFYKGAKFWRFETTQRRAFRMPAPGPISDWPGVPENLDAAFSRHGYIYFFKGGVYYKFDEKTYSMDPASPYETGSAWFGCRSVSNEVPWGRWSKTYYSH